MTLAHVDIVFQLIAFLFAISIHESAHAWMANRCGDPTARMLGRITLNPIKHIDPIGTILMPAISLFTGFKTIGWAKPTPVDPRNFKNPVRDDILTSIVGPISNFLVAICVTLVLLAVKLTSHAGNEVISNLLQGLVSLKSQSFLVPLCFFLYELLVINVVLAVFNLIPIPPLDGSHVLRHLMPEPLRRAYDMVGWFGLIALVYFGGGILNRLLSPVLIMFEYILRNAKV
jgi:Zn-dependent protease